MERLILKKLLNWKNSPYRKPLILKGVRQVGKTWILKEFGKRYYENTAYFNFDESRARARESKELFPDKVKLRIRFFLDNLRLDGDVLNIPLFMADQPEGLMGLALDHRKVQQAGMKF